MSTALASPAPVSAPSEPPARTIMAHPPGDGPSRFKQTFVRVMIMQLFALLLLALLQLRYS